jgi:hypothetical protein
VLFADRQSSALRALSAGQRSSTAVWSSRTAEYFDFKFPTKRGP